MPAAASAWSDGLPKCTRSSPTVLSDELGPSVGMRGAVTAGTVPLGTVGSVSVMVVAGAEPGGGRAPQSSGIDVVTGVIVVGGGAVVAMGPVVLTGRSQCRRRPPRRG
ncbi:MAG: hypothetical protein R2695_07580 [Acidimicrobiales bacterium]